MIVVLPSLPGISDLARSALTTHLDGVQLEDTAAATQTGTYPGSEPTLHGRVNPFEEFRQPNARCYTRLVLVSYSNTQNVHF